MHHPENLSAIILNGNGGRTAPSALAEKTCLLKRYPTHSTGRTFVVGDLHGCLDMLMALLAEIGFDFENDILYSAGDLADRGPDSIGCLRLLEKKWFRAVAGNHEEMLLSAATDPGFNWTWWVANGGAWASAITKEELFDLAALVANLPLAIVVGEDAERFNIIHAEFYGSDAALEDVLENADSQHGVPVALTWGRDLVAGKIDPSVQEDLSLTFCGHNETKELGRMGSQIYLDTGAWRAARGDTDYALTIVEVATAQKWRSAPIAS